MSISSLRRRSQALPVFLILMSTAACRSAETAPETTSAPVSVRVSRVALQTLAATFEAGGVIKARTTAQVSSRIAAEVREITVQPGDRVRQGQILAILDDRDLAARRAQAHASLAAAKSGTASAEAERASADARVALARASHHRFEQLRERNSATPQEMDRATAELRMAEAGLRAVSARVSEASAAVAAAEAAVRAAEVAASFSTIAAPFAGLITNRLLEPGNMASPGQPLVTIESTDGFRLEVQIDAARARFLQVGDTAAIALEGHGEDETMTGRVVEVARAIDPSGHAFVVKVQLPAGVDVRSGTFARARFTIDERETLTVPASAIVRRGQLSLVFVVDTDRRARMRAVTAGARSGSMVEALAGVQPRETVIVDPPASLLDGADVRIIGEQP
jgi:RND family efflux transporter MFP subunit